MSYIHYTLDDPSLKPVTQQYVNRRDALGAQALVDFNTKGGAREDESHSDSTYALIDLYFPQLHLGIECDESGHFVRDASGHIVQAQADADRSADVHRAIADYEEIRIPVEIALDAAAEQRTAGNASVPQDQKTLVPTAELMASLDDAIAKIRARKQRVENRDFDWAPEGFEPWEWRRADWQLAREAGEVRVGDGLLYKHNGHLRALFSRDSEPSTGASTGQINFNPNIPGRYVWAPRLQP